MSMADSASSARQAPGGTLRLSNVHVTDNTTGLAVGGGSILSYGNNKIAGNGAGNGPPSGPVTQQ